MTTTEAVRSVCECEHEPHEHTPQGNRLAGCSLCDCKKYVSKSLMAAIREYRHPPKIAPAAEREQLIAIVAEEIMQNFHFVTLRDNMEMGLFSISATGWRMRRYRRCWLSRQSNKSRECFYK